MGRIYACASTSRELSTAKVKGFFRRFFAEKNGKKPARSMISRAS